MGAPQAVVEKRTFYQRPEVAEGYEAQRFGGRTGQHILQRELDMALSLIPRGGQVADVGSGPGILAEALQRRGDRPIACDTSLEMLRIARRRGVRAAVQADAFALPLADGACDNASSIRLLFHFQDVTPLLKELRRVVRPGGTLVCDTYTWSLRSLAPIGRQRWGAKVASLSSERFREQAAEAGWRVREERRCFLTSPFVYRLLPLPLALTLERIERRVPSRLLCRSFWKLEAQA